MSCYSLYGSVVAVILFATYLSWADDEETRTRATVMGVPNVSALVYIYVEFGVSISSSGQVFE